MHPFQVPPHQANSNAARMHSVAMLCSLSLVVLLTGCARTTRINVPADFHGHVSIACSGNTDQNVELSVSVAGKAVDATCPAHQTTITVMRSNRSEHETPNIAWSLTGDGLVRAIDFDVP